MCYSALEKMKEKNKADYRLENTVFIPALPSAMSNYGLEALKFLRYDCADLMFDSEFADLTDSKGRSFKKEKIPFNMERDLDRLSFERALIRFLESGTRKNAFDIYYCYCEIFHPFGGGYRETGVLLRMLSEHESNASSLLMKHRDHYSHSVYVFCIGLAIYRNHKTFREAYNKRYGLKEGKEGAHHFLQYWGLTSLFHDVGYPFEIAHQQMKSYIGNLDTKKDIDKTGFAPYISYKGMELFCQSRVGDLNDFFAQVITSCMDRYLDRISTEPYLCRYHLSLALKDRAVHDDPGSMDYLYMDHAYFSGLILAKTYLDHEKDVDTIGKIPEVIQDSLCAIILHNSLFKFTMRKFLNTKEPLRLDDGQPLSYLLMLCDELQCWNRTSYGKNTRQMIYPFDFDMIFPGDKTISMEYSFDKAFEVEAKKGKLYKSMNPDGSSTHSKITAIGRYKFLEDIDKIIALSDVIDGFARDDKPMYVNDPIHTIFTDDNTEKELTLSDGSYLSLYQFAVALNSRHGGSADATEDIMKKAFEDDLSLEYKLSNIAQAKRYDRVLETIHCFYTDRAVSYDWVAAFTPQELELLAAAEHELWCQEKADIGWKLGTAHLEKTDDERKIMRERTRNHDLLKSFNDLDPAEKEKNRKAIRAMLELLNQYDGLRIYKLPTAPENKNQ